MVRITNNIFYTEQEAIKEVTVSIFWIPVYKYISRYPMNPVIEIKKKNKIGFLYEIEDKSKSTD